MVETRQKSTQYQHQPYRLRSIYRNRRRSGVKTKIGGAFCLLPDSRSLNSEHGSGFFSDGETAARQPRLLHHPRS